MTLMLAPAANMTIAGCPSGATYVSNNLAIISVTNTADQTALQADGCYTLIPFGGTFTNSQADALYAAMQAAGAIPATSIGLFSEFGTLTPLAAATTVNSGGYATAGVGAGVYVADTLATSALAAAYPRFCAADASGRYWRLAGPTIYVEQGGATGSGNDQPAIQAALSYAAAVGIYVVECQKEAYSLWATIRTTAAATQAPDGHYLVITGDVEFRGAAGGTTFTLLNSAGGAYSTVTQTVSSASWYGGAMFVWPGGTGTGTIKRLTLTRIRMTGGVSYTLSGSVPAGNTGPGNTGVNLTGKGFWFSSGTVNSLYFNDCEFDSVYAEACYLANTAGICSVYVNNLRLHDSPQCTWNPAGITGANTGQLVTATDLVCYNSYAVEIVGGPGQQYNNCRFYTLGNFSATGGPANGFGFNYAYPTRVSTNEPPWVDFFECDWTNIPGGVSPGAWVRIHKGCTATDTFLNLVQGTAYTGACGAFWDAYIDLELTADQAGLSPACLFRGPPTLTTLIPSASAGNYVAPPKNIHVNLNVHRSANAIANGYYCIPFAIDGYIDQNSCTLHVGEADGVADCLTPNYSANNYSLPLVTMDGPTSSQLIGASRPWGVYAITANASGAPPSTFTATISNPRHSLYNGGTAGSIAISLAAPFSYPYGYANGQRTRIFWDSLNTAGTILSFAASGAGMRLNAPCYLRQYGDWLEVEFDSSTGYWHEVDRGCNMVGATLQSSAASPTAPASTSAYTMQGLAGAITPTRTGNLLVTISGTIIEPAGTAAGLGIQYKINYGTGTAPANAAAVTGTSVGPVQEYTNSATVTAADVHTPFSISAILAGLTIGTAYWLDLAAEAISTASDLGLANVAIAAIEL